MAEEEKKITIIPYCWKCEEEPESQAGVVYSPTLCERHRAELVSQGMKDYYDRHKERENEGE